METTQKGASKTFLLLVGECGSRQFLIVLNSPKTPDGTVTWSSPLPAVRAGDMVQEPTGVKEQAYSRKKTYSCLMMDEKYKTASSISFKPSEKAENLIIHGIIHVL